MPEAEERDPKDYRVELDEHRGQIRIKANDPKKEDVEFQLNDDSPLLRKMAGMFERMGSTTAKGVHDDAPTVPKEVQERHREAVERLEWMDRRDRRR